MTRAENVPADSSWVSECTAGMSTIQEVLGIEFRNVSKLARRFQKVHEVPLHFVAFPACVFFGTSPSKSQFLFQKTQMARWKNHLFFSRRYIFKWLVFQPVTLGISRGRNKNTSCEQARMYDISNGKASSWSWLLGSQFSAFWHTGVVVEFMATWLGCENPNWPSILRERIWQGS